MRRGRWAWMLVLGVMPALTGTAEAAQTEDVALRGVKFDPDRVEISVGDTVRWSYESGGNHTLTFEDGPDYHPGCSSIGSLVADCFSSGDAPIEREFKKAGEHAYFCKVHSGMAGVVIVTDERVGGAASTTVPPAPVTTQATAGTTTTTRAATTTSMTRLATTTTTQARSTTTTAAPQTTTTLTPNEAPAFDPGDPDGDTTTAEGEAAGATSGGSSGTVGLIVALLLGVAAAGGVLLWRLRPRR